MQYALLIYGRPADPAGPMSQAISAALDRADVIGWARLHADESATTLHGGGANGFLLTDGPFVDSKEYLAGLILIEADDLDGALLTARRFQQARGYGGAIEVRPIVEALFRAA